ncbi:hypothetical protein ABB07_05375 [Streptomyces incarnatus]|uniref:SnoaL-like domain-containing protein n=1 Tax=Streptomyces incarnatus TaxID=665007 RepID=A0ABN4GDP3_9ACTN|nr:hypothetical protein ABB07_05375 [Streptomyces incarnatus]
MIRRGVQGVKPPVPAQTRLRPRCPPSSRHVVAADEEVVFVQCEYELAGGDRCRNREAITVRDGLIREVRVFFGGRV